MYVIEIRNKATGNDIGYLAGDDAIATSGQVARKFALPADAIPYAEALASKVSVLEFKVVPYVEA